MEDIDILAGLCASAPTTEIRNCVRLYCNTNTIKQHRLEFNKCQKSTLVAALDFLGTPVYTQQTNKPTCINLLICRIQNLLPDICHICKIKYCITLQDLPLLTCEICGQGSHDECILNILKVPADAMEQYTAAQAMAAS